MLKVKEFPKTTQKRRDGIEKQLNRGKKKAQYNLGVSYENGEEVRENLSEAIRWYQKAAEQGHAGAKEKLRKLVPSFAERQRIKLGDNSKYPSREYTEDLTRQAETASDICTAAHNLLIRLAQGIDDDDRAGRIDMGHIGKVTDEQKTCGESVPIYKFRTT